MPRLPTTFSKLIQLGLRDVVTRTAIGTWSCHITSGFRYRWVDLRLGYFQLLEAGQDRGSLNAENCGDFCGDSSFILADLATSSYSSNRHVSH
jgi:hypothetical protein